MAKPKRRRSPKETVKQPPASNVKSSLVARLNTRLFFRLIGIYLCMDLLLVVLCGAGIFFSAYHQFDDIAQLVEERGVPSAEATQWMAAGDYTVPALARPAEGTPLPVVAGADTAVSRGL